MDLCKKNGVKTCSIVNVVESSIARNSDWVLPIHAGPEIGVASTKAFIGQMLLLYMLCLKIAALRNDIDSQDYQKKIKNLKKLPEILEECLRSEDKIQLVARDFLDSKGSMFLGRGCSFPIALEGALIEYGLPVIVISPNDKYFHKTISNMQEVIARGGKILLITDSNKNVISENVRFTINLPYIEKSLSPFFSTIPLQLLAYHVALLKKCDIDKPRNLAKSVTVE